MRLLIGVAAIAIGVSGCSDSPKVEQHRDRSRPLIVNNEFCPALPPHCLGPDPDGWVNIPREPTWEPCAAPPPDETVVIGDYWDLEPYAGCPGYITLHRDDVGDDFGHDISTEFIACVANGHLGSGEVLLLEDDDPPYTEIYESQVRQLTACRCTGVVLGQVAKCAPPGFCGGEAAACEHACVRGLIDCKQSLTADHITEGLTCFETYRTCESACTGGIP